MLLTPFSGGCDEDEDEGNPACGPDSQSRCQVRMTFPLAPVDMCPKMQEGSRVLPALYILCETQIMVAKSPVSGVRPGVRLPSFESRCCNLLAV